MARRSIVWGPSRAPEACCGWAMMLGARHEGVTTQELAVYAGVSERSAARWLARLRRAGFVALQHQAWQERAIYTVYLSATPAYCTHHPLGDPLDLPAKRLPRVNTHEPPREDNETAAKGEWRD